MAPRPSHHVPGAFLPSPTAREPSDAFTTPFGFRWFSWSASQGFSLNGAHYWIQGANVHQDHAGWGNGVSDSALTRDVKMVKDAGMNFIRGSHYPKAPAFADACDQLGILFWSENNFWGGFGGAGGWPYNGAYPSTSADYDAFDANVLASLTDMIRIHRNHPSIIAWSMGNEDFFNGGPADRVVALLKKSVALTHQLDPAPTGRPAAIGGAQSKIGGVEPGTLGDVAGYNGDGVGLQQPGHPQHGFRIRRRRQLDSAGQLRSRLGEPDRHERHGRPARLAQRNIPVVHVRLRQPDGQPVHQLRASSTTSASRSGPTTGIGTPTRRSRRRPGRPRARAAGLKLTSSTTTLSAVDGTQDAWLLGHRRRLERQGDQQQRSGDA